MMAFDFLIFLKHYVVFSLNIVFLPVGTFFPFLRYICRRCVFIHLLHLFPVCLFLVCWDRGSICGVPGHFLFCVELCCVECRAGTIYLGTSLGWAAGLYGFFLWLCCSGYGTIEMVGGVVRVSSHFLQFAVSSLGVRLSVVGLCSFIVIFFGYFFVLFAVLCFIILLIFPYLLQMVEEGIGPGRL